MTILLGKRILVTCLGGLLCGWISTPSIQADLGARAYRPETQVNAEDVEESQSGKKPKSTKKKTDKPGKKEDKDRKDKKDKKERTEKEKESAKKPKQVKETPVKADDPIPLEQIPEKPIPEVAPDHPEETPSQPKEEEWEITILSRQQLNEAYLPSDVVVPVQASPATEPENETSESQPAILPCSGARPTYESIYASIPFNRAEYEANPSYHHDATMELLFGQMRPTVIHRTQQGLTPVPSPTRYFPGGYPYGGITTDFGGIGVPTYPQFGHGPYRVNPYTWYWRGAGGINWLSWRY